MNLSDFFFLCGIPNSQINIDKGIFFPFSFNDDFIITIHNCFYTYRFYSSQLFEFSMATDAIIKKTDPIENKDRLSDLPDSVLLHILSFMKTTQYTVQTCILSKRWKNLWKQFSILTLYSEGFETLEFFIKFVSHLLFLRDQETALHTLKLYLSHQQSITPHLFERILKYVVTCNVKCLRLLLRCDIPHFPISLLSSQTLTSLAFCVYPRLFGKQKILFPNSLNLPSLIKLDLAFVTFSGGTKPFSSCPRLTKLRIICFDILGEQNLCISSTTLVKLTMRIHGEPQNGNTIELYTPSLCTFAFIGTPFKILHARQLSYVEHIKIDAYFGRHDAEAPTILLSWLLELANIKILTVSSNTLQVYFYRTCKYITYNIS